MKQHRLIFLLVLLGVVLAATGFFTFFEKVERQEETGLRGEALSNPLLAFERWVKEMGVPINRLRKWEALELPPANGTIVLGDERLAAMNEQRVTQLFSWVEGGGHLLVEADKHYYEDPLLDRLGITRSDVWSAAAVTADDDEDADQADEVAESAPEEAEADDADAAPETADTAPAGQSGTAGGKGRARAKKDEQTLRTCNTARADVRLPHDPRTFQVRFWPYQNLEHPNVELAATDTQGEPLEPGCPKNKATEGAPQPSFGSPVRAAAADQAGLRLVQVTRGKGLVTVMSNFDLMVEKRLGELDHAAFVWALLQSPRAGQAGAQPVDGPVLLIVRAAPLTLWEWLTNVVWPASLAALLLLLAWIWHVAPRFGPLLTEAPPGRRSLKEHLTAVGTFWWRERRPEMLLAASRAALHRRLEQKDPSWAKRSAAERIRTLAERTGIAAASLDAALFGMPHTAAGLTAALRTLQRLQHLV